MWQSCWSNMAAAALSVMFVSTALSCFSFFCHFTGRQLYSDCWFNSAHKYTENMTELSIYLMAQTLDVTSEALEQLNAIGLMLGRISGLWKALLHAFSEVFNSAKIAGKIRSSSFSLRTVITQNKFRYHLLCAEYLLAVNPDERPDIFQASYVAFDIGGWPCPVHNLHVGCSHVIRLSCDMK